MTIASLWFAALGWTPRQGRALSTSEEISLGRRFELQARSRLSLVSDVEVLWYVNRIGQRLVNVLGPQPFQYRFYVTRDTRVNAFAVPGGVIYLHAGLLLRADSEDEIAGVMGHEIAHVHSRHLARQQEATRAMGYAALLGMLLSAVRPEVGIGTAALQAATHLQYRREFEQEADYQGARWMQQAGYDPQGLLAFFRKLLDEQRTSAATLTPYLLSHPLTETRMTNLEAVLKTISKATPAMPRTSASDLRRVQVRLRTLLEPPTQVIATYRARVEASADDPLARLELGLAYLYGGQPDLARTAFEQAQKLGFSDVARELGRTYLAERQTGPAISFLKRAVAADPEDAVAHFELGRAFLTAGDEDGAKEALRRAVELVPNFEDAHYQLGTLVGKQGDEGTGLYHLGKAFYLRGDFAQAAAYWRRAIALLPAESPQFQELQVVLREMDAVRP